MNTSPVTVLRIPFTTVRQVSFQSRDHQGLQLCGHIVKSVCLLGVRPIFLGDPVLRWGGVQS